MRGEPWRYFNIISAAHLSLNAQFIPVPEGFVHGKITDTVLGTLHLATCPAAAPAAAAKGKGAFFIPARLRDATLGVTFDVFAGKMICTRTPAAGLLEPAPCANALAIAGITIVKEVSVCSLATMQCAFHREEDFAGIEAKPALVRVHMERLNITLPDGVRLSLLRDVIDAPQKTAPNFNCSVVQQWPEALHACEVTRAVARGESPYTAWQALPTAARVATNALFTAGNTAQQLHFYSTPISGGLEAHCSYQWPATNSAGFVAPLRHSQMCASRTSAPTGSPRCMGCSASVPSTPSPCRPSSSSPPEIPTTVTSLPRSPPPRSPPL